MQQEVEKTKKQLEADIVVIAAGTAGLATAVAAAEGGASVIVFEKAAATGGAGKLGMGPFAVESRLQRLKQLPLTREEAFKSLMDYTHWSVDARLVKAYFDKSASTIDWLEKLGVEFVDVEAHSRGFNFTWHVIRPSTGRPAPHSAATMMKILTAKAKELGVEIFLKTPAKKILKEDGRITGVLAENQAGETIQVNAKAVIIATGGFGDNPELIKKYTGYEWGRDLFSFRVPGLVGDGIRMAWEVGAAETEIKLHMITSLSGGNTPMVVRMPFRQPNLMVNLLGERFINEEIIVNDTYTGNAIAGQKNRCAFVIFDESIKKYYEEAGLDFPFWFFYPSLRISNFNTEFKKALDKGHTGIFMANSLEELAEKTGIDADGLQKTVNEYNRACDTGRDELFDKNPKYLKPIKQPQFYACRLFPGSFGTLGGIKINYKTEVLTKDYDVIPGLYAAGNDANTIYGDSYAFFLPGNTIGFALNSGRIAGENAVEYIKSL